MKKIFTIACFLIIGGTSYSQCVINFSDTTIGVTPPDSLFPDIYRGVALDTSYVEQLYVPASITYMGIPVTILQIVIDSVTGFPTGITAATNPSTNTIIGGQHQCTIFQGTTLDTVGTYPLIFNGWVTLNVPIVGDTTVPLSLLNQGGAGYGYSLRVKDVSGINKLNADLNNMLEIFPNPNSGVFELKFNTTLQIDGEIVVVDMAGRKVFEKTISEGRYSSMPVDLSNLSKGLYNVQLKTASGFASKNISIE